MKSMSINSNTKECTVYCPEPLLDACEICNDNSLILKSGNQLSTIVPLPIVPGIKGKPVTISTLTMNTVDLNDSKVKLDFALDIDIPAGVSISYLTFQVFKQYNDSLQKLPIGAEWTFLTNIISGTNTVFSFFVCDNDLCKRKCNTYILEVTPYS